MIITVDDDKIYVPHMIEHLTWYAAQTPDAAVEIWYILPQYACILWIYYGCIYIYMYVCVCVCVYLYMYTMQLPRYPCILTVTLSQWLGVHVCTLQRCRHQRVHPMVYADLPFPPC